MFVEVTTRDKGIIDDVYLCDLDGGTGYLKIGKYLDGYGACIGADKFSRFIVKGTTYEVALAAYKKIKAEWVKEQFVLEIDAVK